MPVSMRLQASMRWIPSMMMSAVLSLSEMACLSLSTSGSSQYSPTVQSNRL